ncbi:MAG TPA: ribosomal-processing cysteine protease Prp [Clostridia bacterium]|nr:ribosomal-processing cysteine protease Prp [Clostridia bacterium]
MIDIRIVRDKEGFIWEFTVKGHAGFDKRGSDIVCAAVSAVAYTAIGALDDLADIKNYSEKSGFMNCSIPAEIPEDKKQVARIILETMSIGFIQIRDTYKKYVSVLETEV